MSGGDYGIFLGGLFIAIRESRVKRWLLDFEDGVFVRRPYSASVVVHRFPSSGSVVQCRHSRSPVYSVVIWREISAFAHLTASFKSPVHGHVTDVSPSQANH
jgi:hypothetical protein